jgi:hypothetical protein
MPTAKPQPSSAPILELSWTTEKNGKTTALVLRLGFPIAALLLLALRGANFELGKKVLKAVVVLCGFGP